MRSKFIMLSLMLVFIIGMSVFQNTAYAAGELPEGDTIPPIDADYAEPEGEAEGAEETPEAEKESYIPPIGAFTPDGDATVVDYIAEGSKEFYTFTTPNENVFYLVIDHLREQDNVYFLNAVTEADLMALAQKDDSKGSVSAIPDGKQSDEAQESPAPDEENPPKETDDDAKDSNNIMFVLIAVALAGAIGYYFKIVKSKNKANDTNDEEYEDDNNDSSSRSYDDEDDDYGDFDDE